MGNAACPQCGYPLTAEDHYRTARPFIGSVRFCRLACLRRWRSRHDLPDLFADVLPDGVERRAS